MEGIKARLTRWGIVLHGSPVDEPDLAELEGKLYFDREPGRDAFVRFAVLLLLSVVIATGGVLGDSTATVIGAMIVAPLMTPIMATALAMVTGDQRHLVRSLLTVFIGVLVAVGVSALIGWIAPGVLDINANSQIQGRIAPKVGDLLVALASGAAGAFALSRRSVADALPGVAIAISLVPPLCVVGICLSAGEVSAAGGAMLLFLTNLIAILVAGGGLLGLMGYGAVARRGIHPEGRRRAAAVTGIALVVLLIPLGAATTRVAFDSTLEASARQEADAWVQGSGYEVVSTAAKDDVMVITIDGSGPIPSAEALAATLQAAHPGLTVRVRAVAAQVIQVGPATPVP
ncbi:MAG: TIGR00341 family protein [Chloroflexota bacterium]